MGAPAVGCFPSTTEAQGRVSPAWESSGFRRQTLSEQANSSADAICPQSWLGDTNMPKAPRTRGASRERILEAASNKFLRSGYAGTTLGSIAAETGITTPAIYWHFRSKEELYSAALEQVLVSFVRYVWESVDAEDPVTRLAQTVAAHVTWQLEQSDVASAYSASMGMQPFLADLNPHHRAKLVEIQREYMRVLRANLAEGRAIGRFEYSDEGLAAYAIVTICEYVHVWFTPGGRLTVEQTTRQIVELALRTVGVEEKTADCGLFWSDIRPRGVRTPG